MEQSAPTLHRSRRTEFSLLFDFTLHHHEGTNLKLAFFGGVYNNYLALQAAVDDARRRGADELYCLGDLGAFGPYPDRVFPILHKYNVSCIQGNYDHSIGNHLNDCQCGYTDPRDNYFAQLSYDYTDQNTSEHNRLWMRDFPPELRLERDGIRMLVCHGSPRKTNEFLWESTTSTHFLDKLAADYEADVILATHTGIHWERELAHNRCFVNKTVNGSAHSKWNSSRCNTITNDWRMKCATKRFPMNS